MKVAILAGGLGTRISEESILKPKPMIQIGEKPVLWHIMKIYSSFGFNEFVILCGYKGYVIKEYFANYFLHESDITIDIAKNSVETHKSDSENWKVTLVNTGLETQTGGRLLKARDYLQDAPFMLTYGDGVGNINISELIDFHKNTKRFMTVTSVQPEGRFGSLDISEDGSVNKFLEKPKGDGAWVNAGFFVCQPEVLNYIDSFDQPLEKKPLEKLAQEGQLAAYKHNGFWKPMDTLRDKNQLETFWQSGNAPWKVW